MSAMPRYSYRIIVVGLFLILCYSIFKFKEFRDIEVIERNDLLNRYANKEKEFKLLTKDLEVANSKLNVVKTQLKEAGTKLGTEVELSKTRQDQIAKMENLHTFEKFTDVNKQYKKWVFIKDKPRYKKVTYVKKSVDTTLNDAIVLSVIGSGESFGPDRKFQDYLDVIHSMEYDWDSTTLGLLVGKQDEYDNILRFLDSYEKEKSFSKIVVVNANYIEESSPQLNRENRHDNSLQRERRRNISKSRNFLVNTAVREEAYTLFLDSDVVKVPKDMLANFVKSGKDVIVPRIAKGETIENYDFNSWKGKRVKPTPEEVKKMDNDPKYVFVPRPDGADHMHDFVHKKEKYGNNGDDLFSVEIDSVGGAVLFMKTELFKQGVQFPTYYIVGTTWDREGYDGIETEGICYQAKLIGYKCWGMPNYVAYHVEEKLVVS